MMVIGWSCVVGAVHQDAAEVAGHRVAVAHEHGLVVADGVELAGLQEGGRDVGLGHRRQVAELAVGHRPEIQGHGVAEAGDDHAHRQAGQGQPQLADAGAAHDQQLAVRQHPVVDDQAGGDDADRQHRDQELRHRQEDELEEQPDPDAAVDDQLDQPHRGGEHDREDQDHRGKHRGDRDLAEDVAAEERHGGTVYTSRRRDGHVAKRRDGDPECRVPKSTTNQGAGRFCHAV